MYHVNRGCDGRSNGEVHESRQVVRTSGTKATLSARSFYIDFQVSSFTGLGIFLEGGPSAVVNGVINL